MKSWECSFSCPFADTLHSYMSVSVIWKIENVRVRQKCLCRALVWWYTVLHATYCKRVCWHVTNWRSPKSYSCLVHATSMIGLHGLIVWWIAQVPRDNCHVHLLLEGFVVWSFGGLRISFRTLRHLCFGVLFVQGNIQQSSPAERTHWSVCEPFWYKHRSSVLFSNHYLTYCLTHDGLSHQGTDVLPNHYLSRCPTN